MLEDIIKRLRDSASFQNQWGDRLGDLYDEAANVIETLVGMSDDSWYSRWERLSPDYMWVLVLLKNTTMSVAYQKDGNWFAENGDMIAVTHWKYLPLPPSDVINGTKL